MMRTDPMHPVISYTLLALCAAGFVFGIWIDGDRVPARFARARRLALLFQFGSIAAAYVVLRPGAGTDGRVALAASAASGRPVLLEMYSNSCGACLMAKPAVDGLERRLGDAMDVARVNIESESGRVLAARYAVNAIPTFVMLDARGAVLYRQVGGMPDAHAIESRLERLPRRAQ